MPKYHYGPDPDHFIFEEEAKAAGRAATTLIADGDSITFMEDWVIVRGNVGGFVVGEFKVDGVPYTILWNTEGMFDG